MTPGTIRPDIEPKIFERRHPHYAEMIDHWNFVESTYRGGRAWFKNNVFQYMREGNEEFSDRVKRAYRFNHTREVVDLVTKYVFKTSPERKEDVPEELQEFWKKATKGGESINHLMGEVSRATSVFGQPYIVVDSTAPDTMDGQVITIAEQKSSDVRPYAYVVSPVDALDMSFDDTGELNWILFRENKRFDLNPFASSEEVEAFRLWTRTHSHLFRVKQAVSTERPQTAIPLQPLHTFKPSASPAEHKTQGSLMVEELQSVEHNLGVVPVVRVRDRDSDNLYHSPSLIDDISYLDRSVANYLSNLDAIIQDQTFSVLTIPIQSIASEDSPEGKLVELGTKRLFAYDAEGGAGPEYISPDVKQVEIILAVVTKIITEIYHSIGMAGERTKMDNAAGIDNSSGVAKAYDFDRMNTMLKAKSDRLQSAEFAIAKLVMMWHGKLLEVENPVNYPEDFDVRGLYDEFDVADRLTLLDAPDELRRHQLMSLVNKLYPNLPDKLVNKIKEDLKNWPGEEVDLTRSNSALKDRTVPPADNKQGQNNKEEDGAKAA